MSAYQKPRLVNPPDVLWTWKLIAKSGSEDLISQASVDWAPLLSQALETTLAVLREVEPLLIEARLHSSRSEGWKIDSAINKVHKAVTSINAPPS